MRQNDSRYIGRSISRTHGQRLVLGSGQYVDDIHLPGTVFAAFLRSPHAHALITHIDCSRARAMPGVLAVFLGSDCRTIMRPLKIANSQFLPGRTLNRWPLSSERVRFVGDPIALVVARDADIAQDALALISVEYKVLEHVIGVRRALAPDAPRIHAEWDSNVAFVWTATSGNVQQPLSETANVISLQLSNNRVHAAPLECRGILAAQQRGDEMLHVWASTQTPHMLRATIAETLGLPQSIVRVTAPDVGGAFGPKAGGITEYLLIAALALYLRVPIKWVETRRECFQAMSHGRDQQQTIRAAVSDDGIIEALEISILADLGAYNPSLVPMITGLMATGPYRISNIAVNVTGVMTHTAPTGAYRGAGNPEACFALERLMDVVAVEREIDPLEVRQRNAIPHDAFPYLSPTGVKYDSGDYGRALDLAAELIDYRGARAEQEAARKQGRLVGIGMALYCEMDGTGWDSAAVRILPDGSVVTSVGASPHGQGTDVAFAQIVADTLGVELDRVQILAGDTISTPEGRGTAGSRSTSICGSAVLLAAQTVNTKIRQLAGNLLEVAVEDIVSDSGVYYPVGAPGRRVTLAEIAQAAYSASHIPGDAAPGLETSR